MISTFYSDMYAFDMERKRWYQLGLKQPRKILTATEKKARAKARKASGAAAGRRHRLNVLL